MTVCSRPAVRATEQAHNPKIGAAANPARRRRMRARCRIFVELKRLAAGDDRCPGHYTFNRPPKPRLEHADRRITKQRTYGVPKRVCPDLRLLRSALICWLPFLDTYRTMCLAPEPAFRRILEDIRELRFAA